MKHENRKIWAAKLDDDALDGVSGGTGPAPLEPPVRPEPSIPSIPPDPSLPGAAPTPTPTPTPAPRPGK